MVIQCFTLLKKCFREHQNYDISKTESERKNSNMTIQIFYWLFERMKHYSILYWLTISNLGIVISNLDLPIQAFKLSILKLQLTMDHKIFKM